MPVRSRARHQWIVSNAESTWFWRIPFDHRAMVQRSGIETSLVLTAMERDFCSIRDCAVGNRRRGEESQACRWYQADRPSPRSVDTLTRAHAQQGCHHGQVTRAHVFPCRKPSTRHRGVDVTPHSSRRQLPSGSALASARRRRNCRSAKRLCAIGSRRGGIRKPCDGGSRAPENTDVLTGMSDEHVGVRLAAIRPLVERSVPASAGCLLLFGTAALERQRPSTSEQPYSSVKFREGGNHRTRLRHPLFFHPPGGAYGRKRANTGVSSQRTALA